MARFADLKNDFVFRKIFAQHPALTAALLNDLLGREGDARIGELTVLPPEQAPHVAGAKLSILDVRCRDQAGRWFVVEMQLLHVAGFLNRVVYNACKAYVGQAGAGHAYRALADVVALSVCDFALWPDEERDRQGVPRVPLVSRWAMRERQSGSEGLTQVQYAFVELPKVPKDGPLGGVAERWAWLFRYGSHLEAIPTELSDAQRRTLELANEASFTAVEHEAYQRVMDEIEQARQLGRDAEARGEFRGRDAGLREGRDAGLREGRDAGLREGRDAGLRQAIGDLCEVLGIALDEAHHAMLAATSGEALAALRDHLKRERCWPTIAP